MDNLSNHPNKEFLKCRKDIFSNIPKVTFWVYLKFVTKTCINNKFICSCIHELNTYNVYSIENFFKSKGEVYHLNNLKNISIIIL